MSNPFAGLPFGVPPQYQPIILAASQRWGIPANVLAAQIQQESGYKTGVTSSAGAEGIAQFEPGTAASLGVNPWNPVSAIDGMAQLDSQYVARFGSIDLALAAYNAGPDAVSNAGNQVPQIPETQSYVQNVLQMASGAGPTGAETVPGGSPSGSGSGGISSLFEHLVDPSFWSRIGKGALAGGIIVGGAFLLMSKQPGTLKPVREMVNVK